MVRYRGQAAIRIYISNKVTARLLKAAAPRDARTPKGSMSIVPYKVCPKAHERSQLGQRMQGRRGSSSLRAGLTVPRIMYFVAVVPEVGIRSFHRRRLDRRHSLLQYS
jgi:hypothetical protein